MNFDGNAEKLTAAIPAVISIVEISSCLFKDGSISDTDLISNISVATRVVIRQTIIPIELMIRGKDMATKSWLIPKDDMDATKSAAQDDSA